MMIFCDRLTLKMCAELVRMRVMGIFGKRAWSIQVLDPVPRKAWHRPLRAALKLLGVNVGQARFFAGHLRSKGGEAVSITAVRWASEYFVEAADGIVESSVFLSNLNTAWGRNTIRLHLAKKIWRSMLDSAMRINVASALARQAGAEKAVMLVARPRDFSQSYVVDLCSNLEVRFYTLGFALNRTGRFGLIVWLLRSCSRELKWRLEDQVQRLLGRQRSSVIADSGSDIADSGSDSVLLLQESQVSFDRSYRTQPHWLFETEGRPPFQTYILKGAFAAIDPIDNGFLKEQGVHLVSKKQMALTRHKGPLVPVQQRLSSDLRRCFFEALLGRSGPQNEAVIRMGQLFFTAARMTGFCRQANVKAFMTSETYLTESDAIQLIGPALGIHTLSYQTTNVGNGGPSTLNNSDSMLMVSALYRQLYTKYGTHPVSFIDVGYPYDTSFQIVRERAQKYREGLEAAGAQFVICYFDENSILEPYGVISPKDDIRDLLILLKMVLDDPSLGLVLKTKLIGNARRLPDEVAAIRKSVLSTGRYVELMYGNGRNIVFPAEAAMGADIAIGHAAGSTAVLEAVLTGCRGILLDPYGASGANDFLYEQADIIYPSLEEGLEAIAAFRSGVPERQNLGDWSSIIDQFDPIRDGQAGHRIRAAIEQAITGSSISVRKALVKEDVIG